MQSNETFIMKDFALSFLRSLPIARKGRVASGYRYELADLSRLDEADLKEVNIHAGIESSIRLPSQYYNSNHITLNRDYGDLPLVECFAGQLNQVWIELTSEIRELTSMDQEG
jgi:signal transduction histidine kinase